MQQDFSSIPLWCRRVGDEDEGRSGEPKETELDRRIRERFLPETDKEVRMKTGDMSFSLVRISLEDRENMERFTLYCDGSPEGKYGVVWRAGCLEDRYVFDTWEYAVEFIVMGMGWE